MAKRRKKSRLRGKSSKRRSGWVKLVFATLLTGMSVLFVLSILYLYDLPSINDISPPTRTPCIIIKAEDGTLLATYGDVFRKPVKAQELPIYVPQAIISIEDKRFFDHCGIDVWGLLRAAWANFRARRYAQGGSTITQQLAKNAFLSPERSVRRKIQEAVLALWLERRFSKMQILTMYLNRVYFGSGTYGIDAAAWKFFQKPAKSLTLYEAAKLAAVLKSPAKYSPFNNPDQADMRAIKVLVSMIQAGYVTQKQAELAINKHRENLRPSAHGGEGYRCFTDWVMEAIAQLIPSSSEDLVVTTTLNYRMQTHAEAVVAKHINNLIKQNKQVPPQVALVCIDGYGAIKAMLGGFSYKLSQFNRATAGRQSGSVFKFFVFLSALDKGLRPHNTISDLPLRIDEWSPKNYHWASKGEISLSDALVFSVNTATVRLARKLGCQSIIDTARTLGIKGHLPNDLTLSLGSGNTSLFELVDAYNIINTRGVRIPAYAISNIKTTSGKILYQNPIQVNAKVFPDQVVLNMRKILTNVVVYGTGKRSQLPISSYGKTGTSNKGRDACFIGGAHSFTAGVWTGHDDMTSTQNLGGVLPASIWRDFMLACVGLASFLKASDIPQLNLTSYPQLGRVPKNIGDLINTLDARR
ncbi:MAG: PBP1A family penicillin-binding protein [Holosporales bacterium]|jgi:penicillin-binding protein 1A|nr:PBP1A family penicillin-binding protein [Holosporales bacterium]